MSSRLTGRSAAQQCRPTTVGMSLFSSALRSFLAGAGKKGTCRKISYSRPLDS